MIQDLGGKWTLTSLGTKKAQVKAAVPGDTHSALLEAGVIKDPYWAMNELDAQWVGRTDWSFARAFDVSATLLAHKAVYLVCERLDTVAEILVNGQPAGSSDNMFVRFRADIKPLLRPGENRIEIRIKSAVLEAEKRAKAYGRKLHPGMKKVPGYEPNVRNMLRKVGCHSGWDWGICLVVAGIYDKIFLQGVDDARIEYVYTDQRHTPRCCKLTVHTEVIAPAAGETVYSVSVGGTKTKRRVQLSEGLNKLSADIEIENPALWWPAGYGAQPLYDLEVQVGSATFRRKLGLRKLEINYKEDKLGRPLTVRVNGTDIFCKGANWIPADAMPARQTRATYANLIAGAVAANMNMLRVWGGGQYEPDAFYELCDKHGVLVWQDFMFACAEYPSGNRQWLASVRREAEHQIKRLRDYACIALWCGDNENLGILLWSPDLLPSWLRHHDRLNFGVLQAAAEELDPERLFWPSSPCAGPEELLNTFQVDLRGDMHFWKVWHNNGSFADYYTVKPRFCSEFGFQSLPGLETIARYAPRDQWNINAPVFDHHQRNPKGNSIITEMFTRHFRMPEGFPAFAYLSQVQQALAIKTAVEYWRTLRPVCMGTLYWQLNDNWPVCSWSSLDHGGKWKLLHHAARRFYAPLMATAFCKDPDTLELWAVNDLLADCPVEVLLAVRDFSGKVLQSRTIKTTLASGSAAALKKVPVAELAGDRSSVFVTIRMRSRHGIYENMLFLAPPQSCPLQTAKISARAGEDNRGLFVKLSTDNPAFYVSVETRGIQGEFDDNMILLLPGAPRILRLRPRSGAERPKVITKKALEKAVTIRHLRATYE